MKLITELDDDVLFLKTLYKMSDKVIEYCKKTKIMDYRNEKPVFTGEETEEEKVLKLQEKSRENIGKMIRSAMEEYPEETIEILKGFIVLDDGEEYPHGPKLLNAILKCLLNNEVLDFFISLVRLRKIL